VFEVSGENTTKTMDSVVEVSGENTSKLWTLWLKFPVKNTSSVFEVSGEKIRANYGLCV
jgi:hypothetical protein